MIFFDEEELRPAAAVARLFNRVTLVVGHPVASCSRPTRFGRRRRIPARMRRDMTSYQLADLTTLGWCDFVRSIKNTILPRLALPGTGGGGAARHTPSGSKPSGFVKFDASNASAPVVQREPVPLDTVMRTDAHLHTVLKTVKCNVMDLTDCV
jgi:hypothetical protein